MTNEEINSRLEKYYNNVKKRNHIITIFMLTHKRPFYVSLAIKSVMSQIYKMFFLIVLDNVSNDETMSVVEGFNDERIIYIERDSSKNELSNPDFAFSICKTKYIAVLHDDDVLHPNFLSTMLPIIEENNYCLLSCSYNVIDENGLRADQNHVNFKEQHFKGIATYKKNEFLIDYYTKKTRSEYILYPTVIYRMSFFKDIQKFRARKAGPSADNYIYMQAERFGGILGVCGDVLFDYRKHRSQVSSNGFSFMEIRLLNYLFTQEYYKNYLKNYYRYFYNTILGTFICGIKAFHKSTIDKTKLRQVFKLIPNELKKGKNRFICVNFKLATMFPHFYSIVFKIIYKIKGKEF